VIPGRTYYKVLREGINIIDNKLIEIAINISIITGNFMEKEYIQIVDYRELVEFIKEISLEFENGNYDQDDYIVIVEEFAEHKLLENYKTEEGNNYLNNREYTYNFIDKEMY